MYLPKVNRDWNLAELRLWTHRHRESIDFDVYCKTGRQLTVFHDKPGAFERGTVIWEWRLLQAFASNAFLLDLMEKPEYNRQFQRIDLSKAAFTEKDFEIFCSLV